MEHFISGVILQRYDMWMRIYINVCKVFIKFAACILSCFKL